MRELLIALERESRIKELVLVLKQLRPQVDWINMPDDFQPLNSQKAYDAVNSTNQKEHTDLSDTEGDKVIGDKISITNTTGSSNIAVGRGASVYIKGYPNIGKPDQ